MAYLCHHYFFEICLEKSKFFLKLLEKIENLLQICLEKSNFFCWIHNPQISNQIDAAGIMNRSYFKDF